MISVPSVPESFSALPGPERRWTLTATDGQSVTGYLPPWAGDDPSEHQVPPEELADRIADIQHSARFPGQRTEVYTAASPEGQPAEEEILSCTIDCTPYAAPPEPVVPVANLHVCGESWITDLDPEALLEVADLLRAQADRLHHEVRPALIEARADWADHQGD